MFKETLFIKQLEITFNFITRRSENKLWNKSYYSIEKKVYQDGINLYILYIYIYTHILYTQTYRLYTHKHTYVLLYIFITYLYIFRIHLEAYTGYGDYQCLPSE